jgi:hypothetical protein
MTEALMATQRIALTERVDMNTTQEAPHGSNANPNLPSAADIRRIIEQGQMEKAQEAAKRIEAEAEELKHRRETFLARKLTPQFIATVMERIRRAAQNGESNILLGRFPSDSCSDGGRRINNRETDWPDALPGIAKEFFEFWGRELRPKGFHLSAEIISFKHGGLLGDVGAYLSWSE